MERRVNAFPRNRAIEILEHLGEPGSRQLLTTPALECDLDVLDDNIGAMANDSAATSRAKCPKEGAGPEMTRREARLAVNDQCTVRAHEHRVEVELNKLGYLFGDPRHLLDDRYQRLAINWCGTAKPAEQRRCPK